MAKIRVLFPDTLTKPTGGLGVQANYMLKNLKDDFDFEFMGQPDKPEGVKYSSVYNPLPSIGHASLVTAVGQMEYFAKAIEGDKPDIIHAFDWSTYFAGAYAAKHFKVPLVCTMQLSINLLNQMGIGYAHDSKTVDGHWLNETHCQMERYGLMNAAAVVYVSEAYAKRFQGLECAQYVVPNGIELAEWEKTESINLKKTGKLSVVYIGRIAHMKNIQAIIEAKIPEGIDLHFVCAEKGGDQHLIEAVKKKCEEPNVHFYGPAYDKDKINVLMNADAVLMPSIHEPFGIVALEALASRSILLSSFVDGMGDFLTSDVAVECGLSAQTIENSLYRLLAMTEAEKSTRIEKGVLICEKYSWSSAMQMQKQVYNDVLCKGGKQNGQES